MRPGTERRNGAVHSNGVGELPAPNIRLNHGELSGVILVKASRVRGASSHETQFCDGDPSVEALDRIVAAVSNNGANPV